MMKRAIIILSLLTLFIYGKAQVPYRLSLADFAVQDTTAAEPSFLQIQWLHSEKDQMVGQTRYRYIEYNAAVGKEFSWIRIDQDANKQLEINQTLYETALTIARESTESLLFSSTKKLDANKKLNQTYLTARKKFLETGEVMFPGSAGKSFDITEIKWKPTGKGGGISFSLNETFLPGATPGITTPITSVMAGFEFFRKKSAVMVDASYGLGHYSGRYCNLTGRFNDGKLAPYWTLSCQYAYRIPFRHRDRISIFAGAGYSNLGIVSSATDYRRSMLQGVSFSEGLMLDLGSKSNTVDFRRSRHDLIESGLRIKLYASEILTLPHHYIVPTLNLGIGYVFSSQSVLPDKQ